MDSNTLNHLYLQGNQFKHISILKNLPALNAMFMNEPAQQRCQKNFSNQVTRHSTVYHLVHLKIAQNEMWVFKYWKICTRAYICTYVNILLKHHHWYDH